MENMTIREIVQIFSIASTFFFLGLSIDANDDIKVLSKVLWLLSVMVTLICVLLK